MNGNVAVGEPESLKSFRPWESGPDKSLTGLFERLRDAESRDDGPL
jgi:hypothetical protein